MKITTIPMIARYLLLAFAATILTNCEQGTHDPQQRISAPNLQSLVTHTDTVRLSTVSDVLRATGRVAPNEDALARIFPLVGGRVEHVAVELGDDVRSGTVLARIRSIDAADAETAIVEAEADYATARAELHRITQLQQAGLATAKDLVAAQQDLERAQARINQSRDRKSIIGGSTGSMTSIRSPISGTILQRSVSPGMQFRPDGDVPMFTIADLSTVWVIANIHESDIASVHIGAPARVRTPAYPNHEFRGIVNKIYSTLDAESRVMNVRIALQNPDRLLKPEMFANVVMDRKSMEPFPAIPARNLVFDNSRHHVIVSSNNGELSIRPVETAYVTDSVAYVRSGIHPGEIVVGSNVLLLYNALRQR